MSTGRCDRAAWPEVLSYERACAVLRDTRFTTASGMGFDVLGITSDPLWDMANQNILGLDGEQ